MLFGYQAFSLSATVSRDMDVDKNVKNAIVNNLVRLFTLMWNLEEDQH